MAAFLAGVVTVAEVPALRSRTPVGLHDEQRGCRRATCVPVGWISPMVRSARSPFSRPFYVGSDIMTGVATAGLGVRVVASRRQARRWRRVARALPVAEQRQAVDFKAAREDFPILREEQRPGVPIVYLDNAATSQKPLQVLAELDRFYRSDNSNVHCGMHTLSIRATEAFEGARAKIAKFVNAADPHEIISTRNASEAINLVAFTWARANLREGDEILLTVMEHHSNLVPWQMVAKETGATLRFLGLTPEGMLDVSKLDELLTERTRLVAISQVSNVIGCVNPIQDIARRAHSIGAKLLVDACQSVPHMRVDVQQLGADWLVASGHKALQPMCVCRQILGAGGLSPSVAPRGASGSLHYC
mmetsp:Transcript_62781/g.204901  ORF Transcript_62781/g.204901 Transcript_62781/m.204901 type:complete len:361 (+) Transcript_62781:85-1167(+)